MAKNTQIIDDGYSSGTGVMMLPGQSGQGRYLVVKPNSSIKMIPVSVFLR
jgi:hypothetical protein